MNLFAGTETWTEERPLKGSQVTWDESFSSRPGLPK
jgi:hypothetical protein